MSYSDLVELTGIGAQVRAARSIFKTGASFAIPFTGDELREIAAFAKGDELTDLLKRWASWAHAGLMRTVRPIGKAYGGECSFCGAPYNEVRPGVWRASCGRECRLNQVSAAFADEEG